MKTVVFFVCLAFALVLCHQDVHKPGAKKSLGPCAGTGADNKALINLLKEGTIIDIPLQKVKRLKISPLCYLNDMIKVRIGDANTGIRHDFLQSCYVVGLLDLTVYVQSKQAGESQIPGSEQCAILPAFQAAYLVQDENANTYMILNPEKAHWFFTAPLGGCDIFVATAALNQRHTPIVIHSNLNSCGNKLQNLEMKGNAVDQMLRRHPGYKLIARVYSAPPPGAVRQQAVAYFQRYKSTHQGIQIIPYENNPPATVQSFQFIGHYTDEDQYWIFTIKGEVDGRIVSQLPVII